MLHFLRHSVDIAAAAAYEYDYNLVWQERGILLCVLHYSCEMLDKGQIPLRRLPRNFPAGMSQGCFGDVTGLSRTCHGEVGVMEFGLNQRSDVTVLCMGHPRALRRSLYLARG